MSGSTLPSWVTDHETFQAEIAPLDVEDDAGRLIIGILSKNDRSLREVSALQVLKERSYKEDT